jgi:small-conductance mechanosensitive channel
MIAAPIASISKQATDQVGSFLPRIGGAIVLLLLGLLVAWLLGRITRRALSAAGADDLADRWGVTPHLTQIGLPESFAAVAGGAVRLAVSLVVIFAALSLVGLEFLSDSLNAAVLAIPKLLIGAALLLAGLVLGGIVRNRIDRLTYQLDSPVPLGQVAQIAVVAVFAITAAAQIAVSTAVLLVLVVIALGGLVGMVALAFGLGGREVARALSAGRYVRTAYEPGQRISVGEVSGEISSIDGVATVLRAADGRSIRVPNHLLIESMVTVESGGPGEEPGPPSMTETP